MNKKWIALGVIIILFGNVLLATNGKGESTGQNIIEIKTFDGKAAELILSQSEYRELMPMMQKLQDDRSDKILIKVLEKLEGKGIEGIDDIKRAIIRGGNDSDSSFLFNIFCIMAGYGDNAFIMLPRFFPAFWTGRLLAEIFANFPLISSIINGVGMLLYLYSVLHPRLSFPVGAWVVARKGTIRTLGLLGYQHSHIDRERNPSALPYPAVFLIVGFKGFWIGFLKGMCEQCFFIGSAIAVFGG